MNRSETRHLALVLVLAFLASLVWCLTKGQWIEGDHAIMGLMALKISQGSDFPIFFWKAHYGGPIASYLAAPLHWFFEPSSILLHSVIIPIHMFYSAGMYFLAGTWLGRREAMFVGLFAALPGQLFHYSALGGFAESMAFVPWIFLLCLNKSEETKRLPPRFFWGGFLCGFALWIFPLAFPPILACFIFQYKTDGRKAIKLSTLGCLLGLSPIIYYNLSQPGATLLRLFSRPSGLDREAATQLISSNGVISFFIHVLEKWALASYHALLNLPNLTLSLFDLKPGASILNHISGFITLFALLFGLSACFRDKGKIQVFLRAIGLTVIITYCFFIVFGLNRDRYLIPILLIIPFGLALGIQKLSFLLSWRVGSVAVASLLLLNGLANFCDTKPRYQDYRGLTQFLESERLTRGYAPYRIAYPLVYLSNERIIYTPAFHEPEYDRYALYAANVSNCGNPVFLFDRQGDANLFRLRLAQSNISFKEVLWGNFVIFHPVTGDFVRRNL